MKLRLAYSSVFIVYFGIIMFTSMVKSLMGGGFGLTGYLNAAGALMIFLYLVLAMLPWLMAKSGRRFRVDRDVLSLFLVMLYLIAAGVLIGFFGNNSKLYLLSTTLYWLNMILMLVYVSSVDCTRTDLLALCKWAAIMIVVGRFVGIYFDASIFNLLACGFVVAAFGERRYWLAALLLLPFVLFFSGLNRSLMMSFVLCVILGAMFYRRSLVFSSIMIGLSAAIAAFPGIDLAQIAEPGTQMYRRLLELQQLMLGETRISDIVALQQRIFEIQLVNRDMADAGPLAHLLGMGFGRTLDMTSTSDTSVMGAATFGLSSVHNVHSLVHAMLLRDGLIGIAYLVIVGVLTLLNAFRAFFLQYVPPLLGICILFPAATLLSALPASNYLLTEFCVPAMIAISAILIRQQKRREGSETVQVGERKRIVWVLR